MKKIKIIIVLGIISSLLIGIVLSSIKNNQFTLSSSGNRMDDLNQIKTLCKNQQYNELALQSLKYTGKNISFITREDLENQDPLLRFLDKTKNLCRLLLSDYELKITEEKDSIWTYRLIIKPFPEGISVAYGLKYFQGRWRFILPQSAAL